TMHTARIYHYTLPLHDALPISGRGRLTAGEIELTGGAALEVFAAAVGRIAAQLADQTERFAGVPSEVRSVAGFARLDRLVAADRSAEHTSELQSRVDLVCRPLLEKKTWREAVAIIEPVAAGLDEAHRVGIVHRDVKPGNIMITRNGHATVMDFGTAATTRA